MIKGTTPTLQFNLPIETSTLKAAEVMVRYVDNNKEVTITRTLDECEVAEKTLTARLTQEETLLIPAPSIVEVQLRVLTVDDIALASAIFTTTVKRLLKEGVIE
jgi:hypothetical protein